MLKPPVSLRRVEGGLSLIEVLVSIVILAFGLLGMASLQSKVHASEAEAYQRSQALLALSDISERISANRDLAPGYVSASTVGAGDSQPASCAAIAAGPARDLCEWSNTLKGASESIANGFGMRGCITQVQAPVTTAGSCRPGIYEVTVVWQGLINSAAPAQLCGSGLFGASDGYRRAVSNRIAVSVPSC
jgi:type IV pilus assembly protein PilV